MNRFYSVMTPPFDLVSGGIRVMWGLYGWLLAKGQVAYPNATASESFVAIYPEIYRGNQANAPVVVRYLLNKAGVMSNFGVPGPVTFDKNDLIYTFSKMYLDTDDEHTLFLPILDLNTFYDMKKNRMKTCFYEGKGTSNYKHPLGSVKITKEFAQDQQQLALLLNDCQALYTYDPVSAMTEIARLCGCPVVYLSTEYTEKDYKKYEPGLNGFGFGDVVKLDVDAFREQYIGLRETFSKRLDMFIEKTQNL